MLMAVALPCLLTAIVHGADWGWSSLPTQFLAATGLCLLVALAHVEHTAKFPPSPAKNLSKFGFLQRPACLGAVWKASCLERARQLFSWAVQPALPTRSLSL